MKVTFLSRLDVRELPHCNWQTTKPFYVDVTNDDGTVIEIRIDPYFVTDFASVPRLPFAYILFGGIGNKAGVLHDGLYSPWGGVHCCYKHGDRQVFEITRPWADAVLRAALETCGVGIVKRNMMYAGVCAFGWKYYKKPPLLPQGIEYTGDQQELF